MYCLELALDIIIYSLLFDDAGIGSTGTDSLANTATNITQVLQYCIIQHAISTMLFIAKFNDCTIHSISVHIYLLFYPIIIIIQ